MSCAWFELYSEGGRPLAPPLEDVHVEQPASGTAIAVFAGEHDLAMKRQVHELLTGLLDDNELVIADFSHAQFVDSSILGVLIAVRQEAENRTATFRLQLGTADIVRRAFEIAGIYVMFDVAHTREAALGEGGKA